MQRFKVEVTSMPVAGSYNTSLVYMFADDSLEITDLFAILNPHISVLVTPVGDACIILDSE